MQLKAESEREDATQLALKMEVGAARHGMQFYKLEKARRWIFSRSLSRARGVKLKVMANIRHMYLLTVLESRSESHNAEVKALVGLVPSRGSGENLSLPSKIPGGHKHSWTNYLYDLSSVVIYPPVYSAVRSPSAFFLQIWDHLWVPRG